MAAHVRRVNEHTCRKNDKALLCSVRQKTNRYYCNKHQTNTNSQKRGGVGATGRHSPVCLDRLDVANTCQLSHSPHGSCEGRATNASVSWHSKGSAFYHIAMAMMKHEMNVWLCMYLLQQIHTRDTPTICVLSCSGLLPTSQLPSQSGNESALACGLKCIWGEKGHT